MKKRRTHLAALLLTLAVVAGLPCGSVKAAEISGYGSPEVQTEQDKDIRTAEIETDGIFQYGGFPSGKAAADLPVPYARAAFSNVDDYLYHEILNMNTSIDMSHYEVTKDDASSVIGRILNEHPELYFADGIGYSYSGKTGRVTRFSVRYSEKADWTGFIRAVRNALRNVDDSMSDLEKALVLHDYLVVNCEYDKQNYDNGTVPQQSYSAYGALVNRTAVCNGYALAYKYLLNEAGIECYMVSSSSMRHAWNLVKIDGQFYQVDATWDDPTWDMQGRVLHSNFLCSDRAFLSGSRCSKHSGWSVILNGGTADYKAESTKYDDAFWKYSRSQMILNGDDCYYAMNGEVLSIQKASLKDIDDVGTAIVELSKWPAWGIKAHYRDSYASLAEYNGRLYYNTYDSICSVNFDGSDQKKEFEADTSQGYIYGMVLRDSGIYYTLHTEPKVTGKETLLKAALGITIEAPRNYNVAFDLQGHGTLWAEYESYVGIGYGDRITEPIQPEEKRFVFTGWYKDAACTQPWDFVSDTVTADMTLYAGWQSGSGSDMVQLPTVVGDISGCSAVAVKYNTLQVRWDPVENATSYEVYGSLSPDMSDSWKVSKGKKTICKYSKANCGQTYYFQIRAYQKSGKVTVLSAVSPVVEGRTQMTGELDPAISKTAYNSVTLKWKKVKGAVGYQVYRADGNGEFTCLTTVKGTKYADRSVRTGVSYRYYVKAVSSGNMDEKQSAAVSAYPALTKAPKLKVKAAGAGMLSLTWSKVPGAQYYKVYRSNAGTDRYEMISTVSAPGLTYMDQGLAPATYYMYKVEAWAGSSMLESKTVGQAAMQ